MDTQTKTLPRLDESLLTDLAPFSWLDRVQVREILNQATTRRFEADTAVFREGFPADRFYILLDGYLRVVHITEAGEQVTTLHIPSGQLFGIAQALGRTTYPATAMTASKALALSWPSRCWPEFVKRYEGFAIETSGLVGRRVAEMHDRIVTMAAQQVEQRIAIALLRLIEQTGQKVEGGIEIGFPITRQDISELTATTLHTVSRLLSAWEKDGIVESRRKRIKVRAPDQLARIARP